MDIVRKDRSRQRKVRYALIVVAVVVALAGMTVVMSGLKRAAPVVSADTVWTAEVKRGEMLRQVRGNGTLVPAEVWWIPTTVEGRVERIHFDPGETVEADTILLELSNPVLERDMLDAEWELNAATANLKNLEIELSNRQLEQEEMLSTVEGERNVARLQAELDKRLFDEELIGQHQLDVSLARFAALENRAKLMKQRLSKMEQNVEAQLAVGRARVGQFQALVALRRTLLDSLQVNAGTSGVLQQVMVEVGQQVSMATTLAKIAKPGELKAELQISETQMRDVTVGQPVDVDTRNGIVKGRVARIDPSVVAGTVLVEVTLEGELPKGARSDLSVEGTIEIDRLDDVLYVARPVASRPESSITLFRLDPETAMAVRVPVQLGRGSVSAIEITEGLSAGDQVIISDMSKWEAVDRVRLK